jgi:hypothetical protein
MSRWINYNILTSVAEPHHFYAAPAPGENFDAAPAPAAPAAPAPTAPAPAAPAPAPTLLYSKAKFLKRTKVYTNVETILFIWFCTIFIAEYVRFCVIFQFLTKFNIIVGAWAVGAGAASLYGSGSDQKMRLLAAPASAPQHWFWPIKFV